VVWDREREEGMMIIYRGKGWEGRIREESKEGRKEERDHLAPNKIPGSATDS
jgi:hypothetical protein